MRLSAALLWYTDLPGRRSPLKFNGLAIGGVAIAGKALERPRSGGNRSLFHGSLFGNEFAKSSAKVCVRLSFRGTDAGSRTHGANAWAKKDDLSSLPSR